MTQHFRRGHLDVVRVTRAPWVGASAYDVVGSAADARQTPLEAGMPDADLLVRELEDALRCVDDAYARARAVVYVGPGGTLPAALTEDQRVVLGELRGAEARVAAARDALRRSRHGAV